MRIKDIFGRYTADEDITFTSINAALNVNVREDNIVEFELLPLMMDASADMRYQLSDPRITTHLTDMDNPHNTISWFIEQTKENPETGDIIYETVVPHTSFFKLNVASIEAYVFPSIEIDSKLIIDIQINGRSIYPNESLMMTTVSGWQDISYYMLNVGEPSYMWENNEQLLNLTTGDHIKIMVREANNIPKVMIRIICW